MYPGDSCRLSSSFAPMAEALSCLGGSLLPRTLLRTFPDGAAPDASDLQTSALEALGSSNEVLEQARCVLSSLDATSMGSKNGVISENNTGHLQGKRQGLGRKRARFSMKPVTSMEFANIHMKLDIGHLADPEEYFSAVEKFEIADKELKKLRGQDSSDLLEHHQVAAVRKRRPGLLGKTASYRHSFGADLNRLEDHLSTVEVCKRVTSSQPEVSIDFGSKDPGKDNSCNVPQERQATQNTFSGATEVEGPITEKENRVGHLLDRLLSSFETLDDDDGTSLLQEQLQLKKINLDKIRLPVTPAAIKKRLTMKERVQKSNMLALTQRSIAHNRSPLAPISLLRKQSLQMDLANDPYSSSPSPTKGINSRESSWKKSVDNMMYKLSLPRQDDVTVKSLESATFHSVHDEAMVDLSEKEANVNRRCSDKETPEDSPFAQSKFALENLPSGTLDKNGKQDAASPSEGSRHLTDFCGLDGSAKMRDIGSSMRENLADQESRLEDSEVLHECSTTAVVTTPLANGDSGTSGAKPVERDKLELPLSTELDFCTEQPEPETLKSTGGKDLNDSSEYAAHCTELCGDAGPCESEKENLENGMLRTEEASRETEVQYPEDHQGHTATSVVTYPLANGDSGISGSLTAENSQELHRNSQVPLEEKAKAHCRRPKRQSVDKRKSLAEAGTKWEAGLRRSTRNRIRPLEFWRGEKLLYGRIHDSLSTVIGIKYSSPGNATLKVKSYVSDEYADLLKRVSLH